VEFKILGPLEIVAGAERLDLGGTRQQTVAATLLLSANEIVTMDRLLDAIYGEDLPPTARSQAQISISSLRRLFAPHTREPVISTQALGYVIRVADGELDSRRFEELVAAARAAHKADNVDLAVAKYRDALRLWRGPALDGIDSQLIRAAASRLDEQHIATNEDRITLELELGRHHELVGELTELVEEFPLRERLRGHLMLALYRCDRTAEALQVYRQTRRTLIDELGIEPGERLQKLEHAILTSDPSLEPPSKTVNVRQVQRSVPSLLPTDIADFTGRVEQVSEIHRHVVREDEGEAVGTVPIVVIAGRGGIGKTSLAIHASQSVVGDFPDGQLFVDLHGGSSHPIGPTHVLERFLRAFGVSGSQMPEGLDERAEMYRNLLADRRVLVVLDDATGESQVSPLLPGGGTAAVIITSRSRLAGLAGATRIEMDVLDADKSLDLLGRIAGVERVQAQREAAEEVAAHCGHLPLALRIAGARLAARPQWSVQQLVERLADETRRLDELRHGDMGIRSSISFTYESAGEQARRLFRRLALLDMPHFPEWLGAMLIDEPFADAEDLLDDLVNAHLIATVGSESGVHSQYRFHDLVRAFARERLAAEEPAAERRAALERALGALLYLAEEAHRRFFGGDYLRIRSGGPRWQLPSQVVEELVRDPLAWYDSERNTLVSGVRHAAEAGFAEVCWGLAASAVTLFESRAYLDDWRETNEIALDATRKAGNVRGEAAMLYYMGSLDMMLRRFDTARRELTAAAELFEGAGEDHDIAMVTRNIAYIDRLSGRLADATRGYEQALAIFRRVGDRMGEACVMEYEAQVELERNEPGKAMQLLLDALDVCRSAGARRIEQLVLKRLGEARLLTGDLANAAEAFELALALTRDLGDPIAEAYAQHGVGVARVRKGELGQARRALQGALALAGDVGERLAEGRALAGLSELALASGDPAQAVEHAQLALAIFRELGMPFDEARALSLLSDANAALGGAEPTTTLHGGLA
jgi:DNA-binding SARP family transcriptional activator